MEPGRGLGGRRQFQGGKKETIGASVTTMFGYNLFFFLHLLYVCMHEGAQATVHVWMDVTR